MKFPPLFVIDNMTINRDMLSSFFTKKNFKVTCFNSAESFLYQIDTQQIGCLILENRLPGIDGLSLQTTLNHRKSPLSLVFHCENISSISAIQAMKSGAIDILFKPVDEKRLLDKTRKAMDLSITKDHELRILNLLEKLTKKEKQVLAKMLNGMTNQQMAKDLSVSLRTIESHRANMLKKFSVNNAVALACKVSKYL